MADRSAIEWCDSTFNPWLGCTKVSPGCDHCYAEARLDTRLHVVQWGAGQPRRRTKTWGDPVKWNKQSFFECMTCRWRGPDSATTTIDNPAGFHPPVAWARGCPACRQPTLKASRARVFCASLADVFDNEVPAQWRLDLLELIRTTPALDWLILTKRIGNSRGMLAECLALAQEQMSRMQSEQGLANWLSAWVDGEPPANVWLGATIVDQSEACRDIPKLLATPARVRFLSMEPLLSAVDIRHHLRRTVEEHAVGEDDNGPWQTIRQAPLIGWVIVGGESGHHARPMHPDWVRRLRDQCAAAGVPFLFKQWGEWTPGENVERQRGTVDTAFLWDDEWSIRPLNLTTDHGHIDDQPDLYRVGKKEAGRLLDGRTHDGFPDGVKGTKND